MLHFIVTHACMFSHRINIFSNKIRVNIFDKVRNDRKSFLTLLHLKKSHIKLRKFINESMHS